MKRKSVIIGLAAITSFCLTACGESLDAGEVSSVSSGQQETDSKTEESTENEETVQQEESSGAEEAESKQEEPADTRAESFKTNATIEETVLVDENDIKITATDLSYTAYSVDLNLLIENNSSKNLSFISGSIGYDCNAINGYMIDDGYLGADVAAGKKSNESVSFSTNNLMLYGITEIADIQIGFDIQDDEYDSFYTGVRQIKTSVAEAYDYTGERYQEAISSGVWEKTYQCSIDYFAEEELYNQNGVRIISEALMTNKDGEKAILVEVQNDSQEMVYGVTSDIAINRLTVNSSRWSGDFINPGARRIIDLSVTSMLDKSYWDAFGISDIGEFSFSFALEDSDGKEITVPEEIKVLAQEGIAGVDTSGTELYNDKGIRIISKGLFQDPKEYSDDIHLILLAENQSSEAVLIDDEHNSLSVNGFMTDCICYEGKAVAGKCIVIDVEIQASSLEENKIVDIEDISDIEIGLEIRDQDYNIIDEPVLSVSY